MLRITAIEKGPAEIHFIVEGRLMGPWVDELETAIAGIVLRDSGCVSINISAVTFADTNGIRLLRRLMDQGVVLQAVSPFIHELLNMRS